MDGAAVKLNRLEWLRFWLWWPAVFFSFLFVLIYGFFLLGTATGELEERCNHGLEYDGAPLAEMRHSYFPMENTCVFEDGITVGSGPLILVLGLHAPLGIAVACAGTAIWLGRPIRRLKAAGVEVTV